MKKTAIHIIPHNGSFVIINMNESAYADFLVGEDNTPVTAFDVQSQGGKIASLLIELEDGVPTSVTTTEE